MTYETSWDRADRQAATRESIYREKIRYAAAQLAIWLSEGFDGAPEEHHLQKRLDARGDPGADPMTVLTNAERDRLPEASGFVTALSSAWRMDDTSRMGGLGRG